MRDPKVRVNDPRVRALYPWMVHAAATDAMMTGVDDGSAAAVGPKDVTAHDFERLFREDGPGVWRTIFAFTGGRRDVADEATAEAFARAIAHAATVRDPIAWIYRTAFRLATAELKRERRRPPADAQPVEPPEVAGLIAALRELSPNQRAAIVLRYEADLPVDEVARRMGIAAPTVRVHVHRGRARLRELLGADDD